MYDLFKVFDTSLNFVDYPILVGIVVGLLASFLCIKVDVLTWFILGKLIFSILLIP